MIEVLANRALGSEQLMLEVLDEGELGSPEPLSETWLDLMDIQEAMIQDEIDHQNEITQD